VRTVTFYSYKGGVGRTLAVANTAIRLAREGLKVFALDFDLEAPGLHHKFNLFPKREPLVIERGLLDFLYEFVTFDRFPDTLAGHVIDVSERGGKASSIHFMPAGRAPSAKYAEHLARIDWHALFYAEGGDGVPLFLELKERIRAEYAPDVLLIDARTGITEMGGVATSLLADQVFALTLKHHEHLEGTRAILRGMRRAPRLDGDAPVRAEVIVTRLRGVGDDVAVDREKQRVKAYLNEPAENLADTVSIDDVLVIRAEAGLEQEERLLLGSVEAELPLLRDYLRIVTRIREPDARIVVEADRAMIEEAPVTSGPPPHNLPARRHFVGRESELDALAAALAKPGAATVTHTAQASLYGFGGAGKTALALEYAHRHLTEYPGGVWWVDAGGAPIYALGWLADTLRHAGTPALRRALSNVPSDIPAVKRAEAVRLALQNQAAASLLVIDDMSEPGWSDHVPGGNVQVLATTRDARFALGKAAPIGGLSESAARKLAIQLTGERSSVELDALDRVVKELGGLALAIKMAAHAVFASTSSWVVYERLLEDEKRRLIGDAALGGYVRGISAALDLTIEQCPPGTSARRLLEGAAVFAPGAVPLDWAVKAAGLDDEDGVPTSAIKELEQLGLVDVDEFAGTLSLNYLVRSRVRDRAHKKTWHGVSERAGACVASWLKATVDVTRMPEVDARRMHVNEVLLAVEGAGGGYDAITIADTLATHLQSRAEFVEARTLRERALTEAERLEPKDPICVAMLLSNLALIYQGLGQTTEALSLLERSLILDETTYGPDHPAVALRLSNLASIYEDLGRLEEARPLLERALKIDEHTYGAEHPIVARDLSNLAMQRRHSGQASDACSLLERALRIIEKYGTRSRPYAARRSGLTDASMGSIEGPG
jgi:MinD-like ATPase involved in chromosome partitioning or flagellar assembly